MHVQTENKDADKQNQSRIREMPSVPVFVVEEDHKLVLRKI